jgi:hypothetical protein
VERTRCMSCRLAPSTASPRGTPGPSGNRRRFTPPLARSVGVGPGFFPPERSLGHRAVQASPGPVKTLPFVNLGHSRVPEFQEDARVDPFLKAVVGGGVGTQLGLMEGFPLAARAEHVKHGVGTAAIRHTRPAATKAVGMHPGGEQWCENGPPLIRHAESSSGAVVRGASSCSFRWLS